MVKDPKQIVTPFAFEVHPDLLGLPLATPKRRLAALLIDLLIAAVLSSLGNLLLATAATGVFFWIAIRTANKVWWQNALRYSGAFLGSILVFGLTMGVLESSAPFETDSIAEVEVPAAVKTGSPNQSQSMDFKTFIQMMDSVDFSDGDDIEQFAEELENKVSNKADSDEKIFNRLNEKDLGVLNTLYQAYLNSDSIAIDTLRPYMASLIAAPEIAELEKEIDLQDDEMDALKDRNKVLKEKAENPGLLSVIKATGEDFGLTVGWVGVYFILSLAMFKGRTLGKKLLGLQVLRLNNKPIGVWYSFERFGGYAAGVATGLLGFFQVFWDSNRQGIHDKIASTVVVDLRKKRIQKVEDLKNEILEQENLIQN